MSNMKAFPNPTLADTQNNSTERLNNSDEYGLDIRDYFAAKAMVAIIIKQGYYVDEITDVAEHSYKVADAMIEARNE